MKRESGYLHLQPYRAIVAPKLRPQKERDRIAYGAKRPTRVRLRSREVNPRSRWGWIVLAVIVAVALVVAVCGWWHVLPLPAFFRSL